MEMVVNAEFDANCDDTRSKIIRANWKGFVSLTHFTDEDSDKIGIHFNNSEKEDDTIDIYIDIEDLFKFLRKIIVEGSDD